MVLKFLVFFLFLSCANGAFSEETELDRLIRSWKMQPDTATLTQLLDGLYFPYLSDGTREPLRTFYDSLRQKANARKVAMNFQAELIAKYTFEEDYVKETPALWLMLPKDARRLFLLIQVDLKTVPDEISKALFKTIYIDIERCFGFEFVFKDRYGVFPVSEYQRLLEIMIRNSRHDDPYLKSWNLYCQGVLYLNLQNAKKGKEYIAVSGDYLKRILPVAETQLAKKMILLRMAQTDQLLEDWESAQAAYVEVLRMDPQDWHALSGLSAILQKLKHCEEAALWVEATAKSNQQLYDITIHCGTREWQPEIKEEEGPFIAKALGGYDESNLAR